MKLNAKSALIFIALVAAGVVARVAFQGIPNFAPVAALALFAGYYFRRPAVAVLVPLLVMGLSDQMVDAGGYPWQLMVTVYGLLALPVFFSRLLERCVDFDQPAVKPLAQSALAVGGFSFAGSVLFFAGTNAMVWATTSIYPDSLGGLLQCFAAAIPFFKYTLAGDMVFAMSFFGAFAAHRLARPVDTRDVVTVGS